MEMDYKKMSLDEKLLLLKKEVSIMQKNKEGFGYKYVDEESLLLKINDKMIEMGVKLTPKFVPNTLHSETVKYVDKKKNDVTDILVRSEMQFIWKDIYSGETEVIDWALLGQQSDASQALGSGLTYSNRYFLLKYFNVSTSKDDPDKIRSEMDKENEKKKLSATQTKCKKLFDEMIGKYQTKEKVYEVLGTTREQFLNAFNDSEKVDSLIEQIELDLKGGKNA